MKPIYVVNAQGKREPFSFKKVYHSARRSGASKQYARYIADIVRREAYSGIKTSEIFRKIKQLLRKESLRSAIRFNLKEAMRRLGPTGFPFEKYIGEVFKSLGYKVKINQYLSGRCISNYEIDFIAEKENLIYIGECKYRNLFGERVHLPDVLSNHARFKDILEGPCFKKKGYRNFTIRTIMVTNTKFTAKSLRYLRCMGIDFLGWKSPSNRGLEYLIEEKKLYPITILPSLKGFLKEVFVSQKMMLVNDVLRINNEQFSKKFHLSRSHLSLLAREAEALLGKQREG